MAQVDDLQDTMTLDMRLRYKRLRTWRKVADDIGGVSPALCWKVAQGEWSNKMARKIGAVEPRVRWSPDCTPELRDAIRAECERRNLTGGELLEEMWRMYNDRD